MNDLTIFDKVKDFVSTPDKWYGNTTNEIPWAVFCGDALSTLRSIPADTYDCTVTSPPYYWLRDYGVKEQIGQEDSVDQYVVQIAGVMDEVKRVLKPHALLFLNLGDTFYSGRGESHGIDKKSSKRRFGLRAVDKSGGLGIGIQKKSMIGVPWRVAIEMSRRGWILRSSIIWHRHRALPEAVIDRPSRSYEFVFMFAKDRKYFFDRRPLVDQRVEEDIWTIMARPKATNGIDTAPFPDELVQRCLDIGCKPSGAVLDPFCGSGTTLRVAVASGRRATGIDLNPAFCEYAVRELKRY